MNFIRLVIQSIRYIIASHQLRRDMDWAHYAIHSSDPIKKREAISHYRSFQLNLSRLGKIEDSVLNYYGDVTLRFQKYDTSIIHKRILRSVGKARRALDSIRT